MRLGAPLFGDVSSPELWIRALQSKGYTAAYCPVDCKAPDSVVNAYENAANAARIVIAEVGAWSNPISPDSQVRRAALAHCKEQLALADRIGARCCVNIAGSRGEQWDGPHKDNLTEETFDLIVESVREILDDVKPVRTFYTLETMPWAYPDSVESYNRLLKIIDRKQFGVHLDLANLINCPSRYYRSGDLMRLCCKTLGPAIRSCHMKDVLLSGTMTVHLQETRPGLGGLDYAGIFNEMRVLHPNTPLMLEHLETEEEYDAAAAIVRGYL